MEARGFAEEARVQLLAKAVKALELEPAEAAQLDDITRQHDEARLRVIEWMAAQRNLDGAARRARIQGLEEATGPIGEAYKKSKPAFLAERIRSAFGNDRFEAYRNVQRSSRETHGSSHVAGNIAQGSVQEVTR
jgi:hypothetical protein